MTLVKVQGREGLVKDTDTGAILNTNKKEIDDYRARKAAAVAARNSKEELNILKERLTEIDELKNDIKEIKELLKGLVK